MRGRLNGSAASGPAQYINLSTEVLTPMTQRASHRTFFQSLVLAGIICFAIPGFAEDNPPAPEEQVSAESAAYTDDSASNDDLSVQSADELPANADASPAPNADESAPPTDEIAADTPEPSAAEDSVAEDSVPEQADPSITLNGRVWRTKPGIVFLKTPVGLLSLSSKTTLKDLLASQEIYFSVHNTHLAIDIRKRKDGSLVHRYLSGPFTQSERDEDKLLLWTSEGEKSFDFAAHKKSLRAMHPGDPVTVEVDEADNVVGVHDLQFDLQIGQIPPAGSSAHLLLTGTVAKMKSNFIFLRTPVGVVNVNTKIGIKNAKIGQTLTLHIHDRDVEVEFAEKKDRE